MTGSIPNADNVVPDVATAFAWRSRPWSALLRRPIGPLTKGLGTVVLVAVALGLTAAVYGLTGNTRLSTVFLAAVLLAALAFGTWAGLFGAVLSFACYNFTLTEPRFALKFAGTEDILTLGIFLAVALTTGGLAGRVREGERAERDRADQLAVLLEASQAQSATDEPARILADLQGRLTVIGKGAAWVSQRAGAGAGDPLAPWDAETWRALTQDWGDVVVTRRQGAWRTRPVGRGASAPVALWSSADLGHPENQVDRLCEVLIDLAGVSLERAQLGQLRSRAEADRQAAELRDAVLASLSHDLRTPLASILASGSSLRDYETRFDAATRRGLVEDIVSEADRLNRYVGNLLSLTRIQARAVRPALSVVCLADLLDRAARRSSRPDLLVSGELSAMGDLAVEADPLLLEQVLFNLLDNALTHAGPAVVIDVRAETIGDTVHLWIADDGPGVAAKDAERLFDRFFQSDVSEGRRRGAGVGLAVARGFIEAMGGRIGVGPRADGRRGLQVEVTLKLGTITHG